MNQITEGVLRQLKRENKKKKGDDILKKKKRIIKKLLMIIAVFIINGLGFMNAVYATSMETANLYCIGDCGSLLKYKGGVVKVSYVQYSHNGVDYPAYCMNPNKPGAETQSYDVSVQEALNDVGLWRIIINGYPYKTIEQLGVASKEEAFTATKHAVYCYLYGNNPNNYEGIGEAGARTLNAMHKIIQDAKQSNESKMTSTIEIQQVENEWKQDEIEKQYVSKVFKVTANAVLKKYKINITEEKQELVQGIKITNSQNQETNEFMPEETFKVLIPIKSMAKAGSFKLTVEGQVKTKPVLYGIAPNNAYQDYALTTASFEDGVGEKRDEYPENETKIILIKEDEKTKERLEETEFEILDENRKVVYSALKTDKEGKIEIKHLVPGKYYIRETKSKEGYLPYEELIELQVALHEQYTITVNNNKEEKPKIETEKKIKSKEVTSSTMKKLPVTGM